MFILQQICESGFRNTPLIFSLSKRLDTLDVLILDDLLLQSGSRRKHR
jgi:DNA replication protein DnaC